MIAKFLYTHTQINPKNYYTWKILLGGDSWTIWKQVLIPVGGRYKDPIIIIYNLFGVLQKMYISPAH